MEIPEVTLHNPIIFLRSVAVMLRIFERYPYLELAFLQLNFTFIIKYIHVF